MSKPKPTMEPPIRVAVLIAGDRAFASYQTVQYALQTVHEDACRQYGRDRHGVLLDVHVSTESGAAAHVRTACIFALYELVGGWTAYEVDRSAPHKSAARLRNQFMVQQWAASTACSRHALCIFKDSLQDSKSVVRDVVTRALLSVRPVYVYWYNGNQERLPFTPDKLRLTPRPPPPPPPPPQLKSDTTHVHKTLAQDSTHTSGTC